MRCTEMTSASSRYPAALLVGVVALGLVAGCDSFIETEPLGELTTASFFETEEQAVQATNATYSILRDWNLHVFAWLGMTDIASDDATKGSTPADASFLLDLDNLNFDPTNIAFAGTWGGYYQGIYRANVAIQNIPTIQDIDEQLQQRLIAENRFLRAYFYFFLVRAYGGVPLITEPLRPGEFEQPRATVDEVYGLIEEDLQYAMQHLPPRAVFVGGLDEGRATQGAARAFLAEVKLFRSQYQESFDIGQQVITSGDYDLFPDYAALFSPAGENAMESVFEVQAAALEQGGGGTQYAQVQGVRGTPNIGWGFNQPSADLEAAYEPGDPRLQATILYPWEIIPRPEGTDQVVFYNPQIPNQRYNQKAFTSPDTPRGSGNAGVNIRRLRYAYVLLNTAEAAYNVGQEAVAREYVNEVRARARDHEVTLGFTPELLAESIAFGVLGLDAGTSRVFVRYIDEASWAWDEGLRPLESQRFDYEGDLVPVKVDAMDIIQSVGGQDITTIDDFFAAVNNLSPGQDVTLEVLHVEQVAEGGAFVTQTSESTVTVEARQLLPPITASGQELLDAIWHERRVEMAMEQHRWFDIIRQDRAQQVMADAGKDFVPGKHENYPIPQREVDLVGLEQNPGY